MTPRLYLGAAKAIAAHVGHPMKPARTIPLTRGMVTLVDAADYERLNPFKWMARENRGTFYAQRSVGPRSDRRTEIMARVIMGAGPGQLVDHINGDTLDNRRANLRIATNTENVRNQRRRSPGASGFRGVKRHKGCPRKPWHASITVNGRVVSAGYFPTAEDAADAYDRAALKHHGRFARTNRLSFCRTCLCTADAPCTAGRHPCRWVNEDKTLCSRCADRSAHAGNDCTGGPLVDWRQE